MTVFIYGLRCPFTREIRYIGKSVNPKRRLSAHIGSARKRDYDHHTSRWIRSLLSAGVEPILDVLHEVVDGEDWRVVERRFIASAASDGARLTNSTAGGEGLDYINPEDKARYLENLRAAMASHRSSLAGKEQMRRMSEAASDPAVVERRTVAIKSHYEDNEEARKKAAAIAVEINSRPEVRAQKSAATKASWRDNEVRQRRIDGLSKPEVKAVQASKRHEAWADPVIGARLRELHASPEVCARKSESARRRATPEYRAMMAEKTRLSWVKRRSLGSDQSNNKGATCAN